MAASPERPAPGAIPSAPAVVEVKDTVVPVHQVQGERGQGRRVPDFFIVGHPKSGTTALYQMLIRHPQIHMPVKEPRFFAPELRSRFLRSRFSRLVPSQLPDTLDDYLSLFAGAGPEQRVGEASPSYLRSSAAAERIAQVAPDARIIAIFREPASFLRSLHLQSVHNHIETQKDFAKAIALEPSRRRGKHIPLLSQTPATLLYSDHVRYVEQLRRYHQFFKPENVLVLIYDDFRSDNAATVSAVLRFLGVQEMPPVTPVKTKPLPAIRSLTLHQLGRAVTLARRNHRARGSATAPAHTARRRNASPLSELWRRTVYTEARPPDDELLLELRRRFKPEVVALSEYLGRDLVSLWGYDNI
jgi:hypothetical protein